MTSTADGTDASVQDSTEPHPPKRARAKASGSRVGLAPAIGVGFTSATALLIITGRYGIGMTSDSVAYIQGARHLADGRGYTASGRPVTVFAPGYSTLLAIGQRFGLDALTGARLLSAAALCCTIALSYVLLRRHVYSQAIVLAGTIGVALSSVLLQVHQEAMSEHVFIVVVLLFVLAGEEHVRAPRALWPLAALVGLSWSAFYLRYAGIAFIGIAGLLVLLAGWRRGVKSTLGRSAIVVVAGVCAPALWMKRNIDLGVPPLGTRHDAAASFGTNASRTLQELERWLTTDWIAPSFRPFIFGAFMAAVVATVVLLLRPLTKSKQEAAEMLPLVLVVSVYITYLVVTASLVAFAGIDFRFLSPVFAPSIILAAWFAERAYRASRRPTTRRFIIGVGLAWLALALFAFGQQVVKSHALGAGGYAIRGWHDSALIKDVRRLDPTMLAVTNDPSAIELFTGRIVGTSPQKNFFGSSEETPQLESFVHKVECRGQAKLVWFLPNTRTFLYSIRELEQRVKMTPVKKERDGVIYDVEPKVAGSGTDCRPA